MASKKLPVHVRTEGDGMEHFDDKKESLILKPEITIYRSKAVKTPEFVPYEPYKAAITPFPSHKGTIRRTFVSKSSQTNDFDRDNWFNEKEKLELQLQDQIRVNNELKKMLVASMGEEMETQMNVLTEDKLHLTQELVQSAQKLSSHREQVEWLAGQSEVWQSKFLASSVVVKDLTESIESLTTQFKQSLNINEELLNERNRVRKDLITIYENLHALKTNFDFLSNRKTLKSGNIIDLAHESMAFSNGLVVQLLGGAKIQPLKLDLTGLPENTDAEHLAFDLLKNSSKESHIVSGSTEAACSAVIGAGQNVQLSIHGNACRLSRCSNCTGRVQLV